MSPEQCAGKALDRRSDVFALGTVLWETLTLTQLFRRPAELATLKAICELPIPRPSSVVPDISAALDEANMRALERRREDRYETASALRKDLIAAVRDRSDQPEPEEELGALMRRLFGDRIEEKAEMLRRARTASAVTTIPSAECDLTVTMPMAIDAADSTGVSSVSVEAVPVRAAKSRRTRVVALVAGVALFGAAVSIWAISRESTGAEAARAGSAPSAAGASPSASPIAPEPAQAAQAANEVALHVESTPPGAKVMRGSVELGITPLDTKVPREAADVEIVLVLPGYLPLKLRTRPEADQRLVATLQAAPRMTRPPATRPTGAGIEKLP
jgi:serine/threonine-protein kinase